jgi:hypothetical protein
MGMKVNGARRIVAAGIVATVLMAGATVWVLATGAKIEDGPEWVERESGVRVLNGPWKFAVGDDVRWSEVGLDDAKWETVDLTAPVGAHDGDVGISGYVDGWGLRGHAGYVGYAWYRMGVAGECESAKCEAMVGPSAADSAYEIFVDDVRVGGEGDFRGDPPKVGAIRPRMFAVPLGAQVIAVRVWMAPWDLARDSGGMRVAPAIGTQDGIRRVYRAQWMQTIRGYVVEVAEAAAFFLLAGVMWTLRRRGGIEVECGWLCVAMICTGLYRANQAMVAWSGVETVQMYQVASLMVLVPACVGSWTMGWRDFFGMIGGRVFAVCAAVLTLIYWVGTFEMAGAVNVARIGLLGLTMAVFAAAVVRIGVRWKWVALAAMVMAAVGQFAGEISNLGVPGIWFPFGVGVSRGQFAYAVFFGAAWWWMWAVTTGADVAVE